MGAKRSKPLTTTIEKLKKDDTFINATNEEKQLMIKLRGSRVRFAVKKVMFLNKYLANGFDAIAAVRGLGYSDSSLSVATHIFLKDPEILAAIEKRKNEIRTRADISIDRLIIKLMEIADFDIADIYDEDMKLKNLHDMTPATRAALVGIEVDEIEAYDPIMGKISLGKTKKVKVADRIRAIELLSRLLGYTEEKGITINNNINAAATPKEHRVVFEDHTEDIEHEEVK